MRGRSALSPLLLVVAALLPYLNCLGNQFVFDDNFLIAKHPALSAPFDFVALITAPYWGPIKAAMLWRPVTTLSFSLGAQLGLGSMFWPHAINLLLHASVTLLWFRLLLRLGNDERLAFCASLLFAVHPLHTEAVTWVSGRSELLAAMFALASIHTALWVGHRRWWSIPLALLAVASKESVIVLPAALLYLRWARGPKARPGWNLALASFAPMLLYLVLRHAVLGVWSAPVTDPVENPMYGTSLPARLLTVLDCAGRYVALTFWPSRLSADYSAPVLHLLTSPTLYAMLGLLVFGLLLYVAVARRGRIEGWAAASTLIFFAIASNLLVPIGTIFAERLFYLPSAGLLLLIVQGALTAVRARMGLVRPLSVAFALVLLLAAARTWARNRDWRDEATFFKEGVVTQPKSPKMHASVAVVWNRERQPLRALEHAAEAMRLDPTARPPRVTYAATLELLDRSEEAIDFLRRVLEDDPTDGDCRTRLLAMLEARSRFDESLPVARAGMEIDPAALSWVVAAAKAEQATGDFENAEPHWKKVALLAPQAPDVPLYLAYCSVKLHHLESARDAYATALRLNPKSGAAANGYAWTLLQTGGAVEDAIQYAKMATAIDSVANHFDTLAEAELRSGDRTAALDAARKAAALEPANDGYRSRLQSLTSGGR